MKSDENMNLETQTKLFGMSEAMKQGMNLGLELGEKAAGEKGTVGTASFRMPEDKKKNLKETLLLYAVTDRRWTVEKTLLQQVEEAILGGATFIQLREKDLGESAFEKEAVEIQELCRKYAVPFVVNDNVEIAKRMGADGVHVGQSDMEAGDVRAMLGPDAILGVSASTVEQAILAEKRITHPAAHQEGAAAGFTDFACDRKQALGQVRFKRIARKSRYSRHYLSASTDL